MISQALSKSVLSIGVEFRPPNGGIASVLNTYNEHVYSQFNFLPTTCSGNIWKKLLLFVCSLSRYIKLCLFCGIDIVHIHGASNTSFWRKSVFIIIAKCLGKRIAYHVHGGGFKEFAGRYPKFVKFVLTRVDAIFALSDFWGDYFRKTYNHPNVRVIPNPVPMPQPTTMKQTGRLLHGLFLGGINQSKGVYDLIEMLKSRQSILRNRIIFHLCGEGEIAQLQERINEYNLNDMIKLEGFCNAKEKDRFLRMADFFVLPSYIEGLPISILEAMSYSLPIISTSVGGIPEIVQEGQNGFLITPGDNDALYYAIASLTESSELREKMGRRSFELVSPHFPDNVSAVLEVEYTSLRCL